MNTRRIFLATLFCFCVSAAARGQEKEDYSDRGRPLFRLMSGQVFYSQKRNLRCIESAAAEVREDGAKRRRFDRMNGALELYSALICLAEEGVPNARVAQLLVSLEREFGSLEMSHILSLDAAVRSRYKHGLAGVSGEGRVYTQGSYLDVYRFQYFIAELRRLISARTGYVFK